MKCWWKTFPLIVKLRCSSSREEKENVMRKRWDGIFVIAGNDWDQLYDSKANDRPLSDWFDVNK